MAIKTGALVLVPNSNGYADVSNSGASSAYACLQDTVSSPDDDSTYVYETVTANSSITKYATFQLGVISGALPSNYPVSFTSTTLQIRGRTTTSVLGGTYNGAASAAIGTAPTSATTPSNSAQDFSSSYSNYTFNTSSLLSALGSYTTLPAIYAALKVTGAKYIAKNSDFENRVTSLTLTLNYQYDETFTVSVTNPLHATITASATGTVSGGTTITLSAVFDEGYDMNYYTVNGTAITGNSFVLSQNSVISVVAKLATPVVTVGTPSRTIISDETNYDQATCSFSCNLAVAEWDARATLSGVTPARGVGLLVESGSTLTTGSNATIIVDNEELTNGDGTYTITVWAHSTNGMWSDGTYEA